MSMIELIDKHFDAIAAVIICLGFLAFYYFSFFRRS